MARKLTNHRTIPEQTPKFPPGAITLQRLPILHFPMPNP